MAIFGIPQASGGSHCTVEWEREASAYCCDYCAQNNQSHFPKKNKGKVIFHVINSVVDPVVELFYPYALDSRHIAEPPVASL